MSKAIWNGVVLAESNWCVVVEGSTYFPTDAVNWTYLRSSSSHTTCPWKGMASYYDVVVEGRVNKDAAWYYPAPSPAARQITDHVAFWKGVRIQG
jgi:uncharacterized protein (DUF427 family)